MKKAADGTRLPSQRTRMTPSDREQQIVRAAARFFADNGFSGSTRELAARIGVVHGLVYRYFPNKDALVDRVYQEVFASSLNPQWITLLRDRSVPIRDRLIEVYLDYANVVQRYEWLRIFLLAGLAGVDITERFRNLAIRRLIPAVMIETRFALDLPGGSKSSLSQAEEGLLSVLHGGVLFIGIRRWVYRAPIREDVTTTITRLVDMFLTSAARELRIDTR